jgi:cell division protein FtsB
MQDIAELERRISAALGRISAGIEALAAPAARISDDVGDVAALQAELHAERSVNEALRARIEALEAVPTPVTPAPEGDQAARIDRMAKQLDVQGIELVRLRKTVAALRENLRALRTLNSQNLADPAAINRAMVVELDSIRVQRLAEVAELDEILAELDPIVSAAQGGVANA